MLGYLMCSHRTPKHARDHLWGLLNPYVKKSLKRIEVKDFMVTLVELATELPTNYFKQKEDTKNDIKVNAFL